MNKHVFLSLLAMDSYNRGYNPGVITTGNGIGTATLRDIELPAGSEGVGFFAQTYDWNGQTVISYRGTDPSDGANAVKDIINGWSSFTRIGTDSQFGLAKQFFNRVTNADFPAGTAAGPGLGIPSTRLPCDVWPCSGRRRDDRRNVKSAPLARIAPDARKRASNWLI